MGVATCRPFRIESEVLPHVALRRTVNKLFIWPLWVWVKYEISWPVPGSQIVQWERIETSKAKIRRARIRRPVSPQPSRVFRISYHWTTFHHHLGAWNRLEISRLLVFQIGEALRVDQTKSVLLEKESKLMMYKWIYTYKFKKSHYGLSVWSFLATINTRMFFLVVFRNWHGIRSIARTYSTIQWNLY